MAIESMFSHTQRILSLQVTSCVRLLTTNRRNALPPEHSYVKFTSEYMRHILRDEVGAACVSSLPLPSVQGESADVRLVPWNDPPPPGNTIVNWAIVREQYWMKTFYACRRGCIPFLPHQSPPWVITMPVSSWMLKGWDSTFLRMCSKDSVGWLHVTWRKHMFVSSLLSW